MTTTFKKATFTSTFESLKSLLITRKPFKTFPRENFFENLKKFKTKQSDAGVNITKQKVPVWKRPSAYKIKPETIFQL
jgi:hypothetical protein